MSSYTTMPFFVCETCNRFFARVTRDINQAKKTGKQIRYCSKACHNRRPTKDGTPSGIFVELTCRTCGTGFVKSLAWIKLQAEDGCRVQYCSRSCAPPPLKLPEDERDRRREQRRIHKQHYRLVHFDPAAVFDGRWPLRTCPGCAKTFHHQDNKRRYCTAECYHRHHHNGQSKDGFRPDLGHYVRSRWEANFARWLRLQGVPYVYEPRRFDLGSTTYLPDFETADVFYEVKGYMSDKAREKIERFRTLYPTKPLIVVGPDEYNEIRQQSECHIPEWES